MFKCSNLIIKFPVLFSFVFLLLFKFRPCSSVFTYSFVIFYVILFLNFCSLCLLNDWFLLVLQCIVGFRHFIIINILSFFFRFCFDSTRKTMNEKSFKIENDFFKMRHYKSFLSTLQDLIDHDNWKHPKTPNKKPNRPMALDHWNVSRNETIETFSSF